MAKLRDSVTLQSIIQEIQLSEMENRFISLQDREVGITMEQFTILMLQIFGKTFTTDQIHLLFFKIDSGSTGYIDWNGFVTYILTELKREHVMSVGNDPLLNSSIHVMNGANQDCICRIVIMPQLLSNGQIDFNIYRYVTASQDGVLTVWSPTWDVLKYRNCCQKLGQTRRKKCPMVLDMVAVPNLQIVAISESDETIHFYDIINANMELLILISKTYTLITCMDYWFDDVNLNESALALGDANGNVTIIEFNDCANESLFGSLASKANIQEVDFSDILTGYYKSASGVCFNSLHDDWVKMVHYVGTTKSFISCSTNPEKSMIFYEMTHGKSQRVFKVEKGINCFYFDHSLNVIVSGGVDRSVRIWNPYVASKAVGILYGHNAPITQVLIIVEVEQILSVSRDKCVKVWDLRSQACLQTVLDLSVKWRMNSFTAAFHNHMRRVIILAAVRVLTIERFWEADGTDKCVFITHHTPMVGVLYSELYNHVVTVSQRADITLWDIEKGQRVIQIPMCHTVSQDGADIPARITAMALDESGRRLLTAGSDGLLKMWSMGNGGLLRMINVPGHQDIHAIICFKQRIFFGGWGKRVYSCNDNFESELAKEWPIRHSDDIMGLGCFEPNMLVTVSWDGKIVIWITDSSYVHITLSLYQNYISSLKSPTIMVQPASSIISLRSEKSLIRVKHTKSSQSKEFILPNLIPSTQSSRTRLLQNIPSKVSFIAGKPKVKRLVSKETDDSLAREINTPITCVLCLNKRNAKRYVGNLMVADIKGIIQIWSIFQNGNLLAVFRSNIIAGHYTNCMTTDSENRYLVTGGSNGYIKIWYIADYFSGYAVSVQTKSRDIFRFPFTRNNLKAASAATMKKLELLEVDDNYSADVIFPDLLSSFQGHLQSVVQISLIEKSRLILSASTDKSVRIWTFSGRYLGTLGDPRGWTLSKLLKEPVDPSERLAPADVRKVASAATLQVFMSGAGPRWMKLRTIVLHTYARALMRKRESDVVPDSVKEAPKKSHNKLLMTTSSQRLQEKTLLEMGPPLGKYFVFRKASGIKQTVQSVLDNKERQVSVLRTFLEPQELTALTLDAAIPYLESHRNNSRLKASWKKQMS